MAVSQTIPEEELKEAYSAAPNYDVDYNDPRFGKVETDKQQALTELEQTYGGMIDSTDKFYDDLKNANQQWADKQAQIQQEQTDFAIEKIEQQKEQAEKDYIKEQSGAYVDYKKQSSKYGTEAEKLAGAGLTNTGYAESSQVSMYNTYQMRVATARDALERAKLNFDNNIKEAMLANNAALAQIYAEAYLKQAELALEGFQYKNDLVLDLANKKIEVGNIYHNQYMDVLQQINTENALKEDIRQYQETQKWNTEQNRLDREHDSAENALQREMQEKIAQAELDYKTKKDELDRQHELDYLTAKTTEEKKILDKQWEIEEKRIKAEKDAKIEQIKEQAAQDRATNLQKANLEKTSSSSGTKYVGTVSGGSSSKSSGKTSSAVYKEAQSEKFAQKKAFTGTTYEQAASYLKQNGISSAGVMTASEWSRRKQSYSMNGIGGAEVRNYSTYAAYLQAYVAYKMENKGK